MKIYKKLIVMIGALLLMCTAFWSTASFAATTADSSYSAAKSYMIKTVTTPEVGSIGGEWAVIGLARSEAAVSSTYYSTYYNKVCTYVKDNINADEQLHRAKSTDNSRIIVSVTSIGKDATNVSGHNLLAGLSDLDFVKKQGINGPIWALIAADTGSYEFPKAASGKTQTTRESLISYILSQELSDGGWALSGTTSDPDITGMALQALAPYYATNTKVKAAADKAISCLSSLQNPDGTYSSWGTKNSESCSQVIVALTSLGINPSTDERFIKNGKSVVDGLLTFSLSGGGFLHAFSGGGQDNTPNQMGTEQAFYALTSFMRFKSGKTSLYDMSDVTGRSSSVSFPPAGTKLKIGKVTYKITVPSTKTTIGSVTLISADKSLTGLVIPPTVANDGITYNVTKVGAKACKGHKALKTVVIGKNVTSIGKQAFMNCTSLSTLVMGSQVKNIDKTAFKGCNLK